MVCDNLSVHRDYDIVEMARSKGIHFINIMPGSSHWFQVHDQEPFGILKKSISDEKKIFSPPAAAKSRDRRTISMSQFYKAEANAFKPSAVRKAFRDVGLLPWNPEIIKQHCEENCPSRADHVKDQSMKAAVVAIKECEQEKLRQCREMVDELMPVEVECIQKAKKTGTPRKRLCSNYI